MQTAIVVLLSKLQVFSEISFTLYFALCARCAFVQLVSLFPLWCYDSNEFYKYKPPISCHFNCYCRNTIAAREKLAIQMHVWHAKYWIKLISLKTRNLLNKATMAVCITDYVLETSTFVHV